MTREAKTTHKEEKAKARNCRVAFSTAISPPATIKNATAGAKSMK